MLATVSRSDVKVWMGSWLGDRYTGRMADARWPCRKGHGRDCDGIISWYLHLISEVGLPEASMTGPSQSTTKKL